MRAHEEIVTRARLLITQTEGQLTSEQAKLWTEAFERAGGTHAYDHDPFLLLTLVGMVAKGQGRAIVMLSACGQRT